MLHGVCTVLEMGEVALFVAVAQRDQSHVAGIDAVFKSAADDGVQLSAGVAHGVGERNAQRQSLGAVDDADINVKQFVVRRIVGGFFACLRDFSRFLTFHQPKSACTDRADCLHLCRADYLHFVNGVDTRQYSILMMD